MSKLVEADITSGAIDDDLIFECRDAQKQEISCWRLVGPLNGPDGNWFKALRDAEGTMRLPDPNKPIEESFEIEFLDFTDKANAQEFVLWRGMKAALEHYRKRTTPALILLNGGKKD